MLIQSRSRTEFSSVSRIKRPGSPMVFLYIYVLVLGVYTLLAGEVKETLVVLQTLFFVVLSRWIFAQVRIALPPLLEYAIALFFIGTLVFGEVFHFYDTIWWWDLPFHGMAGFIVPFILSLFLTHILSEREKINSLSRTQILCISVCASFAVSGLWELYEFAMDHLFDMYMQPSWEDTIHDLVAGGIGATVYLFWRLARRISFFVHSEEIMIQVGRREF
jgi:hypothetical protein